MQVQVQQANSVTGNNTLKIVKVLRNSMQVLSHENKITGVLQLTSNKNFTLFHILNRKMSVKSEAFMQLNTIKSHAIIHAISD
jgi:hypothetical protein